MKKIKKFLLTMAMTMALGTSAFASSGFEFLLNWSGGLKLGIPNKAAKTIGYEKGGGFDTAITAQIGYMFQVKDGFGISLLGELGYALDYYNMFSDISSLSSMFNSFQLGLLPKFNIGFGGRHGLAIGIGGGVKIPISGNYTLNLDLNGANPDGSALTQLDLKREDIISMYNPALIGYIKASIDYYLFFTDSIAMEFGLYLGGDFGMKTKIGKVGLDAFDIGLQLGFRFGPKA
ncbi:PorT family protein [Brachyspira aalborgi]|uniref:PorT family protein n=1 Tax=Brachyspira aalborgi TaxID=29522 RepID=A0A5C8EG16_9SPIR|nr:PorT family protein [Brachyspira aalborgi]TXJ35944.1 PorT family protein [Brachyspira aalborgi]